MSCRTALSPHVRSDVALFLLGEALQAQAFDTLNQVVCDARQRPTTLRKVTGTAVAGSQRAAVAFVSDRAWTEEAAMQFVFARGRGQKDLCVCVNGCWRAVYGSKWSRARAWGKHGCDAGSISQVRAQVWARHTSVAGNARDIVFE